MHNGIKPIMVRTQVTIDNANNARTRTNDSVATLASTCMTLSP